MKIHEPFQLGNIPIRESGKLVSKRKWSVDHFKDASDASTLWSQITVYCPATIHSGKKWIVKEIKGFLPDQAP